MTLATKPATPAAAADTAAGAAGEAPLAGRDVADLVGLAAVWGGSFLFMRMAAPSFGVAPLVLMRVGLGALVLLPFLLRHRAQFAALGARRIGILFLIGALNAGLPFLLFAWASRHAPAGVVAITNAMAVIFTTLIGIVFFGDRTEATRLVALAVGFAGVVVLALGKGVTPLAGDATPLWLPVLAGTSAALCYGISSHLVRRQVAGLPPAATAAMTLVTATIMTAPLAIATWPQQSPPASAWGAAIALGIACTGLAYAFFYRLIGRIGAARASGVTYLVPAFAIVWSWWLLGEPLTTSMALAAAMILGSVAISQRAGRAKR